MKRKGILMGMFASLCLLFATPARADNSFGAIARSPSTGQMASSSGYATQWEAERAARSSCGYDDCRVAVWGNNQCVAVMVDSNGNYGWASGNTDRAAVGQAMIQCLAQNGGNAACSWPISVCSPAQ